MGDYIEVFTLTSLVYRILQYRLGSVWHFESSVQLRSSSERIQEANAY